MDLNRIYAAIERLDAKVDHRFESLESKLNIEVNRVTEIEKELSYNRGMVKVGIAVFTAIFTAAGTLATYLFQK